MATRTRTRPQVIPPVRGSIVQSFSFALPDQLPDFFDPSTRRTLLAALTQQNTDLEWQHDYVTGNQIGNSGEYWKGRTPTDETDILTLLVQDDQLTPAMRREVDAQFVKDPEWDGNQDGNLIKPESDTVKEMTSWHTEAGLTGEAKQAAEHRWWAGLIVGRVYIPDVYAERLQSEVDRPKTLAEALELVHVQAVDPREGGPIIDQHKRVLGYYYRYERTGADDKPEKVVEIHTPTEVCTFLDVGGRLTLDDEPPPSPYASTDRRLRRPEFLMWHATREGGSTITPSLRDAQDSLTVVKTYWRRNDDQTGYRQFIVTNAEQPKNRAGETVPFQMGPGAVVNLRGLTIDAVKISTDAKPQRHTPTWEVLQPLSPEIFHIPSSLGWKTDILEKCDQLWTLNPETQVSGESKRQSRKPFDKRVTFAGQDMGGFVAWALRSALLLAAQVVDQVAEYADVTFAPKIYLDVDAANLDELRVKLAMYQVGTLTLTTLLEATPGVPDAAKEKEAVEKEQRENPVNTARDSALAKLMQDASGTAQQGTEGAA